MILLKVLLSIIFRQILFVVARTSFSPRFERIFLAKVEYLVDLKALHELADFSEVLESEIAFSVLVEYLEARINLILVHVCANSLRNLPELVLVYMTYLIVWVEEAKHVHQRAMFHLHSLP